jgi:hypothetical protein
VNYELCYTSAPRGLMPGCSGFCTVKMTRGTPVALRELLESMSTYRRMEAIAGNSSDSPVAFSFQTGMAAGRRWRILSRIQSAGLDHTNRGNFFAHHVAIEEKGDTSSDPAWLLSKSGALVDRWDYRVEEIAARELPPGREPPRPCALWQAVAGDAGWAGAIADLLVAGKNVYLAYEPSTTVFPLLAEIISVLEPAQRWRATFSTYYCSSPHGVECQLRCVPIGSPAHRAAAGPKSVVVDLTKSLGPPPDSPLVQRARSGRATVVQESQGPSRKAAAQELPQAADLGAPLDVQQEYPMQESGGASARQRRPVRPPVPDIEFSPPVPRVAEGGGVWLPIGVTSGSLLLAGIIVVAVFFLQIQGLKQQLEDQHEQISALKNELASNLAVQQAWNDSHQETLKQNSDALGNLKESIPGMIDEMRKDDLPKLGQAFKQAISRTEDNMREEWRRDMSEMEKRLQRDAEVRSKSAPGHRDQ